MSLNPKHQRFVDEYLVDLNATQAAIRAGYSQKTARSIGHELLTKPDIAAAVSDRGKQLAANVGVTAEQVIAELARVAFSDMRTFATWTPDGVTLKSSQELTEDAGRCVAEVSDTRDKDGGGSVRFKLHNKVEALGLLGKRFGLFTEKVQYAGKIVVEVVRE